MGNANQRRHPLARDLQGFIQIVRVQRGKALVKDDEAGFL